MQRNKRSEKEAAKNKVEVFQHQPMTVAANKVESSFDTHSPSLEELSSLHEIGDESDEKTLVSLMNMVTEAEALTGTHEMGSNETEPVANLGHAHFAVCQKVSYYFMDQSFWMSNDFIEKVQEDPWAHLEQFDEFETSDVVQMHVFDAENHDHEPWEECECVDRNQAPETSLEHQWHQVLKGSRRCAIWHGDCVDMGIQSCFDENSFKELTEEEDFGSAIDDSIFDDCVEDDVSSLQDDFSLREEHLDIEQNDFSRWKISDAEQEEPTEEQITKILQSCDEVQDEELSPHGPGNCHCPGVAGSCGSTPVTSPVGGVDRLVSGGNPGPNGDEEDEDDIVLTFLQVVDLRGGAGGSSTTKKKRELQAIVEALQQWIQDDDEDEQADEKLLQVAGTLAKTVEQWRHKKPSKEEAKATVTEAKRTIGGSLQSFYEGRSKAKEEKAPSKKGAGKGKGGKGKKESQNTLPRIDVARYFPKKDILSWQSLMAAMEKGEKPKGSICVLRHPQHIIEMQDVALATETKEKVTLVFKFGDESVDVPGAKEALLPVVGNLALLKCRIACLTKGAPDIKGEEAVKVTLKEDGDDLTTLRITIPLKFVDGKYHDELFGQPHLALHLLGAKKEIKTYRWESKGGEITGYASTEEDDAQFLLSKSGSGGIFVSRLVKDVIQKPAVTWVQRKDKETNSDYHNRVLTLGKNAGVAITYRRGGNHDLGVLKKDMEKKPKSYAVWGVPYYMGPDSVGEAFKQLGWSLEEKPSENRSTNSPWKIYGVPPGDGEDETFSYKDGEKYLYVVPWKSKRRDDEAETRKLAGRRWYEPTQAFEPDIAPTLMDTQEPTQAAEKAEDSVSKRDSVAAASKLTSPLKKKPKKEADPKVVGGMPGPVKGTRILDCGGQGDCAWRAVGYILGCINEKWPSDTTHIRKMVNTIGAALRASCVSWLLHTNKDWEESFAVDPSWTPLMEGGPVPSSLEEYKLALQRPNRWIDHLGLMAIAETKRIQIVVWQLKPQGWKRCAIIHPSTARADRKYPIVPLVLSQQHYMAITKDGISNFPAEWVDMPLGEEFWVSHGIQTDIIQSTQEITPMIFRGGAEDATPVKDFAGVDLERMLQSCRSLAEDHEKTIDKLLKSCSSILEEEPKLQQAERQWKCPFCSFKVTVAKSSRVAADMIAKHLQSAHPLQRAQTIRENAGKGIANIPWSGLGLRKLLEPYKFEEIKEEERKFADFICPFCKMGMKNQPSSVSLRKRSKLHHLGRCDKKPKRKVSLKEYYHISQRIKGTKLNDFMSMASKHRTRPAVEKAKKLGHAPVSFPFRRISVRRQSCKTRQRVAYWCETCHQASNCAKGHQPCQTRAVAAPSLRWWQKFSAMNKGFDQLAALTGSDEGSKNEILSEWNKLRKAKKSARSKKLGKERMKRKFEG
eukprot:s2555_g6.t1